MDRTRTMGVAMGVIRTGVGAALVVAPRWATRLWVGPGADDEGSLVLARALGARDVVLGASTLAAVNSRSETRWMLQLGFLADLADVAASVMAWRHMDPRRRVAIPVIAASVGVAGLLAARLAAAVDAQDDAAADTESADTDGAADRHAPTALPTVNGSASAGSSVDGGDQDADPALSSELDEPA